MNLLIDPWVPVREGGIGALRQITFEELLCREGAWQVSLPRDDFEMACLQLLICLTQVMFMPADRRKLRERLKTPLSEEEFSDGVRPYSEWFDLDHPQWPFMQSLKVTTNDVTPIQKLFTGMPAGNNHALFNEVGEINQVCGSCAVIALFNQNSNSPNFSGKHKGGLRGGAPISTFISGANLRETIWLNVLCRELVDRELGVPIAGEPIWVDPIAAGEKVISTSIALIRGLFWLPVLVRLNRVKQDCICDCCGYESHITYRDFNLGSDFKFEVLGAWPHPHTPRKWVTGDKAQRRSPYMSFRNTAPAWTQLSEFIVPRSAADGSEGQIPAASVTQFGEIYNDEPLHLLVGGYQAKQSSVVQRRHELFSIAQGWADHRDSLKEFIEVGLGVKDSLCKHLSVAAKGDTKRKLKGIGIPINKAGEYLFFQGSESIVHERLRVMHWRESARELEIFVTDLAMLCQDVFTRLTDPHAHKPELIPIIARARHGLTDELHKLKAEVKQHAT